MINQPYLAQLPPDVIPILANLFGDQGEDLSYATRSAYYLYGEDRVPADQWTQDTFFRMAGRRGWSEPETRRRWAQFQRVITQLMETQETPILLQDCDARTIRVSAGSAPWMLMLHCTGYDWKDLNQRLQRLKSDGWRVMEPIPVDAMNAAFQLTVKKASSNVKIHVADLVYALMQHLGMTQCSLDCEIATLSSLLQSPDQPTVDVDSIKKRMRLILADWRRLRNWLELYRQSYGSGSVPSLNTLARIYELVATEAAPAGFHTTMKRLDGVMKEIQGVSRDDESPVDWDRFLIVAEREPLLRPLWQKLEADLIQGITLRLQRVGDDALDAMALRSAASWKSHIVDQFRVLHLAGEVFEEREKLHSQIEKARRWVDWQATRQLVLMGDESAVEPLLAKEFRGWLAADRETCAKALELAAQHPGYETVLALRDILPFVETPAIHQWSAQAYVAQQQDIKAMHELAAIKGTEWNPDTVLAATTALIRLGKHEEALPLAMQAVTYGWLDSTVAPDMVDVLVLTGSLVPRALLDFCNLVIANLKSYSRAKLFESVYERRINCLLDTPGVDPATIVRACEDWTEVLIANGLLEDAWEFYKNFHHKLKDPMRLQWLDSLAEDIPEAITELTRIAWQSMNNPVVHAQATSILRAYKALPVELNQNNELNEVSAETPVRHQSLLLAGATQGIRARVKNRLVNDYGFNPASIAEVASPWEGHTTTSEIRALVETHDLVVVYTAMMKHSLWNQLDVPSDKVLYPPSGGVSGALQVILARCRPSSEASKT